MREPGRADHCPGDELLAAWSEGRVSAAEQEVIDRHVAACATCADVVAAALGAADVPAAADATAAAARVAARSRTASPARERRLLVRRLALAASVALATAALAYAGLGALAGRARDELARRATDALGEPVAIGRVGLGLTRDARALELRVREVRVGSDDPLVVDDLTVRVSLASLAARRPQVTKLRVAGAVIHLRGGAIAAGTTRLGGANAVAVAVGAAPLELVDGTVVVDLVGAPALRCEQVAGTTTPADGRLDLVLAGVCADGAVTVEGALALDTAGSSSITIGARNLALAALPVGDRVSGAAELSLRVTGPATGPTVAGRVLVRDGRVRRWNPWPEILTAVANGTRASAVTPALAGATVVSPTLTGPDLSFDELRVAFASQPQGWRVSRLYLSAPAIVAGASLQIGPGATLNGNGTVRLAAPLAAVVAGVSPTAAALRERDLTLTLPVTITGSVDAPLLTPTLPQQPEP